MSYNTPTDTRAAPYPTIVRVTYSAPDGRGYQASGVLIAANVVLTAGHVADDAQLSTVVVTPDQSGSSAPYGSCGAAALAWLPDAPGDGMLVRQQSQYDIGLIALSAPVGRNTGWMSLATNYAGGTVQTAGYPAVSGGLLQTASFAVSADATTATLLYPTGTISAGSSGSPLWVTQAGVPTVVGVVSTAAWGAALTAADLDFIQQFEAAHPASQLSVAAIPPTIGLASRSGGANAVTDDPAPTVAGTALPGDTLLISVDGVRVGDTVAGSGDGAWIATLPVLGAGAHQVSVSDIGQGGGSATLSLHQLPAPVAGVSTVDMTSVGLSSLLGGGTISFLPNTHAVRLLDGTLELGADTNGAFLARLYGGLLGRAPDAASLSALATQLDAGGSRAAVCAMVLGSDEYAATHPPATDAEFVRGLYARFLGRPADADGLGSWTAALAAGNSRADVAAQIAGTTEAASRTPPGSNWIADPVGATVAEVYATGLRRLPGLAEWGGWTDSLHAGLSTAGFAAAVVASPEFGALHGAQTTRDFVTSLYQAGLGRAPDAAGAAYWAAGLQSGALTRADVLVAVAGSTEAQASLSKSI